VAALRSDLGLDRPLPARYAAWLGRVVRGDLGHSISLERPVVDEIVERGAATALRAVAAFALAVGFGIAAGALAARFRGRPIDGALRASAVVGLSTPPFWLAMLAVLAFAVWLPWFPVSGMRATVGGGGALDVLHHLFLPALVLATVAGSVIARVTRSALLETQRAEFVKVARARGLSEARIWFAHILRPGLVQVVPIIGLQAGYVIGGALYVETVFQWPGLGRSLVEAVAARDLLLVQGGALAMAVGYVGVNLVADLVQAALDPRIRR
jgi:peptide/nickel transport system permease protein